MGRRAQKGGPQGREPGSGGKDALGARKLQRVGKEKRHFTQGAGRGALKATRSWEGLQGDRRREEKLRDDPGVKGRDHITKERRPKASDCRKRKDKAELGGGKVNVPGTPIHLRGSTLL